MELFVFSFLGTLLEICESFTFSCDYYLIYLTRIIGIVKNVSYETGTLLVDNFKSEGSVAGNNFKGYPSNLPR